MKSAEQMNREWAAYEARNRQRRQQRRDLSTFLASLPIWIFAAVFAVLATAS